MMLTSLGYAPVTVDRASRALEHLRHEPFDLVLMDVQMPELDGLEATRRLRRGDAGDLNRTVYVIALTAGATEGERQACQEAGMSEFISKPITRPVLLDRLAAAFASKPADLR